MPSPRPIYRPRSILTEGSPPFATDAHMGGACRVCGFAIRPRELAFVRAYAVGLAHVACGWLREDEKYSVPGSCYELTSCPSCSGPMYIKHTRPGPWEPTPGARCVRCIRAANGGAA